MARFAGSDLAQALGRDFLRREITGIDLENVAAPGKVRVYDGARCVGNVRVPLNHLVPFVVENVWYFMMESEDYGGEGRPPDEIPKTHLLLKYVCGVISLDTEEPMDVPVRALEDIFSLDTEERTVIVTFAGHLQLTQRDLELAFSAVGPVSNVHVGGATAAITFQNSLSAPEAVRLFDGGTLNAQSIRVVRDGGGGQSRNPMGPRPPSRSPSPTHLLAAWSTETLEQL